MVLGFFAILLTLSTQAWSSNQNPTIDLSRRHYPILQGNTSDSETYFNALLPRVKDYELVAIPINTDGSHLPNQAPIKSVTIGQPTQDSQGLLHDKIWRFKISGLNPDQDYELLLNEVRPFFKTVDRRRFKTLNTKLQRPLKYAAGSCFCDETVFTEDREIIWQKTLQSNPEFIVMMGDQVYVDSFDYVKRNSATDFDIWARNFRSFSENPLFRSFRLVPVFVTWDDHDTGVDNGNKLTPTIKEARRAFDAIYGSESIPEVAEQVPGSTQRFVRIAGQNFILLDNRSFRSPHTENERYSHLGQPQEEWLLQKMRANDGPFALIEGGMWGSQTVLGPPDSSGNRKRITESHFSDHPVSYNGLMQELINTKKFFYLLSGDIHFSQVIEHGPKWKNTSRYLPFRTVEITSSPAHSIVFWPKPGEEPFWQDKQRIEGYRGYNMMLVTTEWVDSQLKLSAKTLGLDEKSGFTFNGQFSRDSNSSQKGIDSLLPLSCRGLF